MVLPGAPSKVETATWNCHKKAQESQKAFQFFRASCAFLWPFPFSGDFDVSLPHTSSIAAVFRD